MGGGGVWLNFWVLVGYIVIDVLEYWFCVFECIVKKKKKLFRWIKVYVIKLKMYSNWWI